MIPTNNSVEYQPINTTEEGLYRKYEQEDKYHNETSDTPVNIDVYEPAQQLDRNWHQERVQSKEF